MNTRNFKCFQTLYEEKNLQNAANKLFLSPQGLSKIIKSLEDECGTTLFLRTKDGFVPTESGKIFYERSRFISKSINEMFSAIGTISERERRFRIGFAAGTLRAIDVQPINNFMKSNPEFVSSWNEYDNETILKRVIDDDINCGLIVGKHPAPGLISELIKSVEIVLYVYNGHRLWNMNKVSINEIKNEPLVSMNENYHIYHDVLNACNTNGFSPEIIAKVGDGETIHTLVKNKIGIGISPKFFPDSDDIRSIPIIDAYTWDVYGIYLEKSPDAQLAQRLFQEIRS